MKTTIDIPDKDLKEAMKFLKARTKREAVITALRDFNRRHRMAMLIRHSGTCDFVENESLEKLEADERGPVGQ